MVAIIYGRTRIKYSISTIFGTISASWKFFWGFWNLGTTCAFLLASRSKIQSYYLLGGHMAIMNHPLGTCEICGKSFHLLADICTRGYLWGEMVVKKHQCKSCYNWVKGFVIKSKNFDFWLAR
jgi:hypothetical protein